MQASGSGGLADDPVGGFIWHSRNDAWVRRGDVYVFRRRARVNWSKALFTGEESWAHVDRILLRACRRTYETVTLLNRYLPLKYYVNTGTGGR